MKSSSLLSQPEDDSDIARRVSAISVSAIKEVTLLSMKLKGVVSLGWGLPSFRVPEHIRNEVIRRIDEDPKVGKYSLLIGMPELRQAIAERLLQETGHKFDPDSEIVITVGAMEALHDVLLTLVERGDEVIIPSPCFSSHIEQILLCEGKPVFVPLTERHGWRLDINTLKKKINNKTKALLLTSPVNPTGSILGESELREIARLVLERNLYVVTDETYNFLVYDGKTQFRLSQIHELKDRLITCRTFSKEYAMTGFRVGYMFGPQKVLFQTLKVHDANVISAPTISQYAALAALNGPQDCVAEFVAEFNKRRILMCNRLDVLSDYFTYVKPEGAYYFFVKFNIPGIMESNELVLRLLNEARVATVPGSAFGPGGEGHIRLSYGGEVSEIEEAFDRLDQWIRK